MKIWNIKSDAMGWRLFGGALLLWTWNARAEIVIAEDAPRAAAGHINIHSTAALTTAPTTNVPPPAPVLRTEDALSFVNGDRLHGKLAGLDGASGLLTWQHKGALDPTRYRLAVIDALDLRPRQATGRQPHNSLVQLVNGDRLCGDVVALDASQLVFRTWYAGTLTIARARLAEFVPAPVLADLFYAGPDSDLAGWTVPEGIAAGGLAAHNGALLLSPGQAIGRKIPNLPEKVRFEFEASSAKTYFSFWFFSDSPQSLSGGEAYGINFSSSRIELRHRLLNGGMHTLGSVRVSPERRTKNRLLVTLLADRQERRFVLLLDGKLVREFTDPQEFKGAGEGIIFQAHALGSIKISRIEIARWDGRLPKPEGGEGGGAVEQDTLLFGNGDVMAGTLRTISTNSVRFETSYAALDVPLGRIAHIRIANKPAVPAPLPPGVARCFFNGQDAVTLKLEKIADESVTGTAEGIGALKIPLGALSRLDFNPTAKRDGGDADDEL